MLWFKLNAVYCVHLYRSFFGVGVDRLSTWCVLPGDCPDRYQFFYHHPPHPFPPNSGSVDSAYPRTFLPVCSSLIFLITALVPGAGEGPGLIISNNFPAFIPDVSSGKEWIILFFPSSGKPPTFYESRRGKLTLFPARCRNLFRQETDTDWQPWFARVPSLSRSRNPLIAHGFPLFAAGIICSR